MSLIKVRAVAGRVAFESPTGKRIPHDKFVQVERTAYIDRLVRVHGDIEVQEDKPKPVKPAE